MDPIARMVAAGAAGAAGGDATYVDDVFSTFLYEGTSSNQAISNGLDLSTEGGLVWLKNRNSNGDHWLFDTERGATKGSRITNDSEYTLSDYFSSFDTDGFTVGSNGSTNYDGFTYASWSFRKAPKFFDVVTYTGTGVARTIAHNLGSVPGLIITKCTSHSDLWQVYHRSLGAGSNLYLNATDAAQPDNVFGGTTPTDSVFSLSSGYSANYPGRTFVAYLFAHDDQSFGTNSDESIINCGSFTTNGSGVFTEVNLGWEPQWLLIKRSDSSTAGTWILLDNMRGLGAGESTFLYPNLNNAEASNSVGFVHLTPTGFKGASSTQQQANATYIYMAIRRPHKPPTAGTEVFAIDTKTASSANTPTYTSNFPVDLALRRDNITSTSDSFEFISRLTNSILYANQTNAEQSGGTGILNYFAYNNGWASINGNDSNDYLYMFRRAPGFFDVVTYTGTGSARTVSHNLKSVPEMMIFKSRSSTDSWGCYHSVIGATGGIQINFSNASFVASTMFNDTQPTSSVFTVGSAGLTNGPSKNYIAYLFASQSGVSKVGSYTGTGSNVDVDCGFTAGARFVLIKRTDSTGDWYVWDTARGIVSGNDPYLLMNSNAAEVTNTDYIDPLNAGFTVTSSAPAALNASGGTYLFLAIA